MDRVRQITTPPFQSDIVADVQVCGRCGAMHPNLRFVPLEQTLMFAGELAGQIFTHYSLCPVKRTRLLAYLKLQVVNA